MLNSSGNWCLIQYLDGLHAIVSLHARGSYLGHTSQHILTLYNVWVRFIEPKSWFAWAVHIFYFNFAVSSLYYFPRMRESV